jgi:hypothetical protein
VAIVDEGQRYLTTRVATERNTFEDSMTHEWVATIDEGERYVT